MQNKKIWFVLPVFIASLFLAKIDFAHGQEFACIDGSSVLTVNSDGIGDCETIQDAVDNIADGGLISVGDGTYQENLVILSKYFTLRGNVADPSAVTIDANYLVSGIDIRSIPADSGAMVIEGFNIINGRSTDGAGIYIYDAYAKISSCIFYLNDATGSGGAIMAQYPSDDVTIERSKIYSNVATNGGAIYIGYAQDGVFTMKNNVIYDNLSHDNGGAIYVGNESFPSIYNNTFVENDADNNGGAIYLAGESADLNIINNVFYHNSANYSNNTSGQGGAVYLGSYLMSAIIDYNSFYINGDNDFYIHGSSKGATQVGANNITGDPLFTAVDSDDFTLTADSTLVDAGDDLRLVYVDEDYDEKSRPIGEAFDIGAYEYGEDTSSDDDFVSVDEDTPEEQLILEQTYCTDNSGTVEERSYDDGATYSVCVFTDGSECDADLYYAGFCQIGDSLDNTTVVYIDDFTFVSDDITINAGESVTWINNDDAPHQIVIDDYLTGDSFGISESYTYTFDTAGTYSYYCGIHPTMTAIVNVIGDTSSCGDFPDVNAEDFTDTECDAITWAQDEGIFTGSDETGELNPADEINRAETTKVLIETFGFDTVSSDSTYTDVIDDAWYTPYIMAATENSIVEGYSDGSFKPESTVNKVEMLKIILETAGVDLSGVDTSQQLFSDVPADESTDWYRKYAYYAYENGLIEVEGDLFEPAEGMLREDVIMVLYRLMN